MVKKSEKDCPDWCPMEDGTRTGDTKYCNLSLKCMQLGMRTDWDWFNDKNGVPLFDYYCTGMYATHDDKGIDEEIS